LQHQDPVANNLRVRRETAIGIGVQCGQRGDAVGVPSREDGRGGEVAAPAVEDRILGNDEQDLA
jgi:hypothetical protein